ncbi:hypothetical protein THAOC_19102, partial [Thalassiosira oceanica]
MASQFAPSREDNYSGFGRNSQDLRMDSLDAPPIRDARTEYAMPQIQPVAVTSPPESADISATILRPGGRGRFSEAGICFLSGRQWRHPPSATTPTAPPAFRPRRRRGRGPCRLPRRFRGGGRDGESDGGDDACRTLRVPLPAPPAAPPPLPPDPTPCRGQRPPQPVRAEAPEDTGDEPRVRPARGTVRWGDGLPPGERVRGRRSGPHEARRGRRGGDDGPVLARLREGRDALASYGRERGATAG